jgi:hypothetical protein
MVMEPITHQSYLVLHDKDQDDIRFALTKLDKLLEDVLSVVLWIAFGVF